jgi:hypothetical protein
MTPEAIVETALADGLSLIAITDHNEILNVERAIKASERVSLTVIPGVELSTAQGHLLCYLPSLAALQDLHGKLDIADRGSESSRCRNSLLDCLILLETFGGFGILAHLDIESGFEVLNPGAGAHKADVLNHPSLLGIELKHPSSPISYAPGDPVSERVRLGRSRIEKLRLGSKQFLARVLNSDAHTLAALGRNAEQQKRLTRYKMDSASFQGLKLALEDADARVRLEDQVPTSVPYILGVSIEGGFLSGQVVQFSSNLNCIIGGRGTGKSTAFEAVRCLTATATDNKVVDSEVWPDDLQLFWQDQARQHHSLLSL